MGTVAPRSMRPTSSGEPAFRAARTSRRMLSCAVPWPPPGQGPLNLPPPKCVAVARDVGRGRPSAGTLSAHDRLAQHLGAAPRDGPPAPRAL